MWLSINQAVKLRASTSASLLEVKGDPASFREAYDLPHGAAEWAGFIGRE